MFFKFIFSKSKFIEFPKFQNLTFLKLGESYDSAIFYQQTDRKILVLQANVPDVRQATQNPTMLRNLTFKKNIAFKDQNRNQVPLGCLFANRQPGTCFCLDFQAYTQMRPREAYFINRHGTFRKEETFNFPEHQKILKSIKKSLRKVKKSKNFLKILDFLKKSKFSKFPKILKFPFF